MRFLIVSFSNFYVCCFYRLGSRHVRAQVPPYFPRWVKQMDIYQFFKLIQYVSSLPSSNHFLFFSCVFSFPASHHLQDIQFGHGKGMKTRQKIFSVMQYAKMSGLCRNTFQGEARILKTLIRRRERRARTSLSIFVDGSWDSQYLQKIFGLYSGSVRKRRGQDLYRSSWILCLLERVRLNIPFAKPCGLEK